MSGAHTSAWMSRSRAFIPLTYRSTTSRFVLEVTGLPPNPSGTSLPLAASDCVRRTARRILDPRNDELQRLGHPDPGSAGPLRPEWSYGLLELLIQVAAISS